MCQITKPDFDVGNQFVNKEVVNSNYGLWIVFRFNKMFQYIMQTGLQIVSRVVAEGPNKKYDQ